MRTAASLRALPAAISRTLPPSQHSCKCRCGAGLTPTRAFSTSRTRQRIRAWTTVTPEKRVLKPADALKRKGRDEQINNLVNAHRHGIVNRSFNKGYIKVTAREADSFLNAFVRLCSDSKAKVETGAIEKLGTLLEERKISQKDALFLAFTLQSSFSKEEKPWGHKLLLLLSGLQYEEATIQLMYQLYLASQNRPHTLKASMYAKARGHLQQMAREGVNVRAMVLEGLIAKFQGDEATAIQLWWSVLNDPVRLAYVTNVKTSVKETDAYNASLSHLATPWLELITVHFERIERGFKEQEMLEMALKIGMDQDDPAAFYGAATYREHSYSNGDLRPTSEWLYLMTKAAASGVPKAAHELGKYYWNSGWKYIEDEPPAHMKPTPFDSFKPDSKIVDRPPISASILRPPDADQLFRTATYPSTPKERAQLAVDWLRVAMDAMYAPSYLLMAKIANIETLWAGAQAPAAALALRPERYTYASEAEYNSAKFQCDEGEDRLVTYSHIGNPDDDPPNPHFDKTGKASQKYLVDVFRACKAVDFKVNTLKKHATAASADAGAASEDEWAIETTRQQDPPEFYKFYRDDAVYDQWALTVETLRREAEEMCDSKDWTLYDEQSGLIYRADYGVVANLEGVKEDSYLRVRRA